MSDTKLSEKITLSFTTGQVNNEILKSIELAKKQIINDFAVKVANQFINNTTSISNENK